MGPRIFLVVGVSAAAIVVAACGHASERGVEPGAGSQAWADAPAAELEPSGMVLTGGTASMEPQPQPLAIDGAGDVWTRSAWQLTRVDQDGRATTWDGTDDVSFALNPRLVASNGAAVWLVFQESIRLFDGSRFVAELTVPDELLSVIDDPRALASVTDAAEVGAGDVWVAVASTLPNADDEAAPPPEAGRVVRFSEGLWSTVAEFPGRTVGDIVVDAEGTPWVMLFGSGDDGVLMWDGERFVAPAPDDPARPTTATGLAAAPDRGVYVLDTPASQSSIRRFDGTRWAIVADDAFDHIGPCRSGDALAADATGVWVAGSEAIAHVSDDGAWSEVAAEPGSTAAALPAVAAHDDQVVVRTAAGLSRVDLETSTLTTIWVDDAIEVRAPGWLRAVAADEVWLGTQRYHAGTWSDPFATGADDMTSGVLATDGAMWFLVSSGLARASGDDVSVVAEDVTTGGVVAGPDSSVWVVVAGDVVGIAPDGTRTPIGRPASGEVECLLAGGADGSVWVDTGCGSSSVPVLARWDGTAWNHVEPPGPDVWLMGITVTDEGTAWGAFLGDDLDDPASGVAYYADGVWQTFPGWPSTLSAGPGGQVCSLDDPEQTTPDTIRLRCYDTSGLLVSLDVPWDVAMVSIAPDGAIWVGGGQVARLGATVEQT